MDAHAFDNEQRLVFPKAKIGKVLASCDSAVGCSLPLVPIFASVAPISGVVLSSAVQDMLAPRAPIWVPTSHDVARTQLSAFMRRCEHRSGRRFTDYAAFEAFCVEHSALFWTVFLEWSDLLREGELSPAVTSDQAEYAQFFPSLRLNYADNLLRVDTAEMAPSKPALTAVHVDGSVQRWSRGQLRARVSALSAALRDLGVGPQDCVVLMSHNSTNAIVGALAASAIGCAVSAVPPELGTFALLSRLQRIQPALLLAELSGSSGTLGQQQRDRVAEAVRGLPSLRALVLLDEQPTPAGVEVPTLSAWDLIRANEGRSAAWPRLPFNHPLFILFSSGTTGAPKCLVHGAGGTLLEHIKEHRLHCDLRSTDRLFFHTSTGWMMWNWQLSALASGVELVLYDGPITSADCLWRIVAQERVSVFGTSPGYLQLCRQSGTAVTAGMRFEALRAVLSTGSTLFPLQQNWFSNNVKRLPIQSISGGTDIIGCFVLGNPNLPAYSAECQCSSLGLDVRALAPDGTPAEGIGELVCANPFPSRPVGLMHDPGGVLFHDTYFKQNPGYWTHGDLIEVSAEGSVRMHGRTDGVLNVRGIRIGPAEIYRVLEGVPEVCDAMAVEQSVPDEIGGSRLVLLLVLMPGCELDERLRADIKRKLGLDGSAAYVPAVMLAVQELPTTYNGKRSERSARDALNGKEAANMLTLRNPQSLDPLREFSCSVQPMPPASMHAAPAGGGTLTAAQMTGIWERLLDIRGIGENDNFFDLGGDSITALRLVVEIEAQTGQMLPPTALIAAPTIAELIAAPNAIMSRASLLPVLLKNGSASMPLFIVPGFGGSVMELYALAQLLRTESAVYGIRASGSEPGEAVYDHVEDMGRVYLAAIREIQPHGPYMIAGYSFGGLVAYEMAQRLVREGEGLALLVLLDTTAHERYWPTNAWLEHLKRRVVHHMRRMRALPWTELAPAFKKLTGAMLDRLGRATGAVDTMDPQGLLLPESLRRLRRAGLDALAAYRPRASGLPITLMGSDLNASSLCDPRRVWRNLTPALTIYDVPGNHMTMIRPPHLPVLAAQLSQCVNAARAGRDHAA
jgi:acetoacetyl-CoA synthetase